jgi:chorismate-pyruvate lyase
MKIYDAKENLAFKSSFYHGHPVQGNIDVSRLSMFQRVLLTTDGTVTNMLEVYAGEEIQVIKLSQEVRSSNQPLASLDMVGPYSVLDRKILLRGKSSQRNLLYAESTIALDRLKRTVRNGLLKGEAPIGRLLLNCQAETFRKIMSLSKEPVGALARYFHVCPSLGMISRTYQIVMGRQPVMQVTEKFPETHFLGLEDDDTEGY